MLRMTAWLFSCATALAPAFAQPSAPGELTPIENETVRDSAARYLAQCLQDWDKTTHMSKEEWARTCRRVAGEREEFMRERPGARSTR